MSAFIHFRRSLLRRTLHTTPIRKTDRPTVFTNMLAGDVPPPVQVSSVTSAGIQLADGLILPSACIFLDGKVFLWDVPTRLWDGWGREHWDAFEVVVPKPGAFEVLLTPAAITNVT
jgi:NADH dehydrogenase [ubiquinone] 1 alpha subcomplex assembly factor 3